MPDRSNSSLINCCIFAIFGCLIILASSPRAFAEPTLFRSTIRIEPTVAQLETLPESAAAWRLQPVLAARLGEVLLAGKFPDEFSAAAKAALSIDPATGIGHITATPQLLDLLPPSNRFAWWAILATFEANRPYRWPISLSPAQLDMLDTDSRFAEVVDRIRRWGVADKNRIHYADTFALEDAFTDRQAKLEFYQQLLGANTEFLKQISDSDDPARIEADAKYWESESRNREIEPFVSAIATISGHDRIDIAHLLPRLPRSLLYTYPPSFEVVEEPSVENAALAAAFFSSTVDTAENFPDGFSAWLQNACAPVSGPREYGDIIVFEDPDEKRWPFSMVYIADGIVFGRRPTLYGPWEFLLEAQIRLLNPRLRGGKITVYRQIQDSSPPRHSPPSPVYQRFAPLNQPELESLPPGPWGNLKYYQLRLAPSTSLIETLPEPSATPVWKFHDTSASKMRDALAATEMPASTRDQLAALFAKARPDAKGIITLSPSSELVLSTPPAFREKLFPRLVPGANAADYSQDFYFPTKLTPEEWFAPGSMPDTARQLALQLTYKSEQGLRLSDFGTFHHSIADPVERLAAVQAVMSTPVVILLMEKPTLAEVPQIADYWRIHQQKSSCDSSNPSPHPRT